MIRRLATDPVERAEQTRINQSLPKLAVQGDVNYMSKHYFQLKNSPEGRESAYAITNARITYATGKRDRQWTCLSTTSSTRIIA